MKQILLTISFFVLITASNGQPVLKPSIGVNYMPSDTDSVCYIPMFTGGFFTSGIQEGDTASDFKLYNLSGDSIILSNVLSSGKPALVIAGSYTCPVFRNKVGSINNVYTTYGSQIEVIIVYTIEAHPDIDTSVYFGFVNTGSQNINAGILYRQPVTYGERKQVVIDMLADLSIMPPVYLDGPCNNWWSHYGPAPNNAYLIDTNGVVFSKHGWYDKFPENIICDIDSLLGNPASCNPGTANGSFTFNLLSNDTIYDAPGATITFTGELVNNSSQDVIVDMYKIINNLPANWSSSLCADVCYPTTTDSASILVPSGIIQPFYFYMYTDLSVDTGRARVGFRNRNNSNNQFARNLFGITEQPTSINSPSDLINSINFYPNPTNDYLYVNTHLNFKQHTKIVITDLTGKRVSVSDYGILVAGNHQFNEQTSHLNAGLYFLEIEFDNARISGGKLIITR